VIRAGGRRPAFVRLPAVFIAVWAVGTGLAAPAGASSPLIPRTTTSVSCLPTPHPVTAEQAAAFFELAARKLGSVRNSGAKRYPFGALHATPDYTRTSATAWTSGFFAAELWLLYQRTQETRWLDAAREQTRGLVRIAGYGGSHDLGFMVGLPTGLGASLDPSPEQRAIYAGARATAAQTLAKRWNPRVLAMKSSDYDGRWGLIIDSAMNAPLLIEIGQLIGGVEGQELEYRGTQHMLTLARDFVRPDGSTFHRMAYNPKTGALIGPIPGQGFDAKASTWARGQAWAINGFTRAYELTQNPALLEAAQRTAAFWVSKVPPGCIPAWDFDIGNTRAPRDSSAAAIAADGLLSLRRVVGATAADYGAYADVTLGLLTTPWITTARSVNPGLLLQQSLNVPNDPREGSYVWGDFYLLSALSPRAPA